MQKLATKSYKKRLYKAQENLRNNSTSPISKASLCNNSEALYLRYQIQISQYSLSKHFAPIQIQEKRIKI